MLLLPLFVRKKTVFFSPFPSPLPDVACDVVVNKYESNVCDRTSRVYGLAFEDTVRKITS